MVSIVKTFQTKTEDDNPFWDIDCLKRLLGYSADIYVVQSPRNVGKSYSAMMYCQELMDLGHNVCWLRYNNTELEQAINTWIEFNPNLKKDTSKSGKYTKWYVDTMTGKYIMFGSWNVAQNMKGIDVPFAIMVCDEFIPERYTQKTRLDTEYNDWTSVYKSIVRSFNMKVLLISNNIYWLNPFFVEWKIPPFQKGTIYKVTHKMTVDIDGSKETTAYTIAVENVRMSKACIKRNLKQSAIGCTTDSDLQSYFNNATKDEYQAIGKCPNMKQQLVGYQFLANGYYFSYRLHDGKLYWTKCKPDLNKETYVSSPNNVNHETKHYRVTSLAKALEDSFNGGDCIFDTAETLFTFYRWLRELRTRV